MEQKVLDFTVRKERKKGPAKRLRRMGKIPSIIYGHNKPVAITIDENEFNSKFKKISESTIIKLKGKPKSFDVLVKDYQEDYINGKILHLDFYEVEKGKLLKTHVAIHLKGTSIGVREGGILEYLTHEIEIECFPKDLPEEIVIDISSLDIGQSIHISELPKMEGVRFITPDEQVICAVVRKAAEEVVEEEEEEGIEEEEEKEEEDTLKKETPAED